MSGDKGKFSTEIGHDVIEEALRSVKRRTEPDAPVAPSVPPGEVEVPVAVDAAPLAEDPRDKEIAELKVQLEFSLAKGRELMEKIKLEHEKMLRAAADLENFKRRAAKEKEEVQRFGSERLLKDLLPIVDNLDRALEHSKTSDDYESLRKGVEMTRKLFDDTLARYGVKSFTSLGKNFDPRFHEAMQQVERADQPPNQVVGEVLRGFTLNDRLVRPALVTVSKAPVLEQVPASPAVAEGETQQSSGREEK